MREKIGKVLSRILSTKHDAKIKIKFKEGCKNGKRKSIGRTCIDDIDAGSGD